jgi:hypothetical protein
MYYHTPDALAAGEVILPRTSMWLNHDDFFNPQLARSS